MKIVIIHGVYNNPSGNWFPWLKEELEKKGHHVLVPKFPTPVNQSLENWMKVMEKIRGEIGDDVILVGHSIGAAFMLSYIEKHKARAAFFVAGFHKPLGISLDKINATFVDKQFDWAAIKKNCKRSVCLSSENDPYIPMEVSKEVSRKIGAELIMIPNGGHLNKDCGYTEFPLLKEIIIKELREI